LNGFLRKERICILLTTGLFIECIGTFEQELDPADFFRISRKFIILKAIKEIVVYSSRLKVILPSL
jgi:DNA-binding LytR/AlgR family response regulator